MPMTREEVAARKVEYYLSRLSELNEKQKKKREANLDKIIVMRTERIEKNKALMLSASNIKKIENNKQLGRIKARNDANKEKISKYNKTYHEANKEKKKEYNNSKPKEEKNEYSKAWYNSNKEKVKARRKANKENLAVINK
jgi:hypothetical protein